jgi:hypothetical protein
MSERMGGTCFLGTVPHVLVCRDDPPPGFLYTGVYDTDCGTPIHCEDEVELPRSTGSMRTRLYCGTASNGKCRPSAKSALVAEQDIETLTGLPDA